MTENEKPGSREILDHPHLERMEWECDELGVFLTCFFEYEPEERGAREVGTGLQLGPDYPSTFTLMYVYTPGGLDISSVMKLELIDEIERWAADQFEERWGEDKAQAAYERWLSRESERG